MMGDRAPSDLTDAEKIDWLWRARDRDHARMAALTEENAHLQQKVDRLSQERDRLHETVRSQAGYIAEMSRAANEANERAANAVQEYIEQTQG